MNSLQGLSLDNGLVGYAPTVSPGSNTTTTSSFVPSSTASIPTNADNILPEDHVQDQVNTDQRCLILQMQVKDLMMKELARVERDALVEEQQKFAKAKLRKNQLRTSKEHLKNNAAKIHIMEIILKVLWHLEDSKNAFKSFFVNFTRTFSSSIN